jgi:glycosyltransferase involved in cell wall biosynthesis
MPELVWSQWDDSFVPRVSVVVPLYNARQWVADTLRSVLEQSIGRDQLEVIVVDDGSTDGSTQIAAETLAGSGVNARLLQVPNGGPSRARNVGWRAARAAWIQFLDADDLLHPRKLETQLADPEKDAAAVLYSDWTRLVRCESWIPEAKLRQPRIAGDPIEAVLRAENFVQLGACMIAREWLQRVSGFREEQRFIEDVNLLLRIALAGGAFRYVATEQPVLFYRQHDSSLSRTSAYGFARGCYENAKLAEAHWERTASLTRARRILLAEIYAFASKSGADESVTDAKVMLKGSARLVLPAAGSARGLRLLARLTAYDLLGFRFAERAERLYHGARKGFRIGLRGRKASTEGAARL